MQWKNIRALVCGASKGIGREIAIELTARGAQVHAVARSEKELQSLGLPYSVVDFSQVDAVNSWISKMETQYHVLVCNSGGPASGLLVDAKISDFQSAFQTLGLYHKVYTPVIKSLGVMYTLLVTVGFIMIPVYIYFWM